MKKFEKDPDATLDYTWKWGNYLKPDSDTIFTSEFIAEHPLVVESDTFDNDTATVWLSGGNEGSQYEVINRITTTGGRTDDRTALFVMVEK